VRPVELVSFDPGIKPPQLITIYISDADKEMVMAPASAEEYTGKFVFLTS